MSQVSNNNTQVNKSQNKSQAPKSEPKKSFGSVLKNKQNKAGKTTGQQLAAAGRDGGRGRGQGGQAQMGQMGSGKASAQASTHRNARSMLQSQNPQLAKMQEAGKKFDAQLKMAKESSQHNGKVLSEASRDSKADKLGRSELRASDAQRSEARSEVHQQQRAQQFGDAKVRSEAQQMAQKNLTKARAQMRSELISGVGAAGKAGKNIAAVEVKGARKPQEIPQELIDKLVDGVRVGVNEVGHAEFQIDLKDGIMQGMTLRVSADNGKVTCQFVGGDASAKNFIESSEGDLSRALENKGLRLEKLSVKVA